MRTKKIITIMAVGAMAMAVAIGCGKKDNKTTSGSNASESGITGEGAATESAFTTIANEKYLNWKKADYDSATAEDVKEAYVAYVIYTTELTGQSTEGIEESVNSVYDETTARLTLEGAFSKEGDVTLRESLEADINQVNENLRALQTADFSELEGAAAAQTETVSVQESQTAQ